MTEAEERGSSGSGERSIEAGAIEGEHGEHDLDGWSGDQLRQLVTQLREAAEARHTIGMAQGILMATEGITSEAAFDVLRRSSNRWNTKLRTVAAELVARYEQPR